MTISRGSAPASTSMPSRDGRPCLARRREGRRTSAASLAHSDGDVILHALTDAVLGALADGDIGTHFPPSDPQWRGASSDRFLAHAVALVRTRGGIVDHLDATLLCESAAARSRIARRCGRASPRSPGSRLDQVSLKATTTEKLGFTGRGEGIAAQAAATIRLPETPIMTRHT